MVRKLALVAVVVFLQNKGGAAQLLAALGIVLGAMVAQVRIYMPAWRRSAGTNACALRWRACLCVRVCGWTWSALFLIPCLCGLHGGGDDDDAGHAHAHG